ncbi:MAG: hypothetical protein ACYTGH_01000 [Planctomycetota bacterium]
MSAKDVLSDRFRAHPAPNRSSTERLWWETNICYTVIASLPTAPPRVTAMVGN